MIEIKTLDGGLNQDDSQYRLPPNDYISALNITHDAVEGNNDKIITPIIANRIGDDTYVYPSGALECIGAYANTLRNTAIQFIWNSEDHHLILEYSFTTRLHTKIFENLTDSGDVDVLGFTQDGKILSINVYNRDEGDLLFFLDSLGRPTGLDITLFKQGEYTPVTRDILDKAKKPPLSPPNVVYDNDTTRRSNNFRKKLMRFKYRWIYDDLEKSSWSPISIVALPVSILDDTFTNIVTNNNVIRMVANTGDKNVKEIEIAMSFVEGTNDWSDFQSVIVLKKTALGLSETTNVFDHIDDYIYEITQFSGTPAEGTIINAYFILLPSTEVLAGTYAVALNDTLTDIAAGLAASMDILGVATAPYSFDQQTVYAFHTTIYAFSRVEIILSSSDNDNIDFPFAFYNDSTYPTIDIEESIELYDYVPRKANAQELLNGNILAYIGITEGYNKDTVENATITVDVIEADGSGGGGSLFVARTITTDFEFQQVNRYIISGIPLTGTIITVKAKRLSDHSIITASTYTTVAGDTIYTVAAALEANDTAPNLIVQDNSSGNVGVFIEKLFYEPIVDTFYSEITITSPSTATATNSIATWKWSTERTIAREYFDNKGETNGVLYTNKVTFPAYNESVSHIPLLPFINYKINDIPPIWAYSVQFLMNKDQESYIAWESLSVNKEEAEYIYFEVTSFITNASKKPTTATVLSYNFKDGDRMRIWRDSDIPGTVFPDTYDAAVEGLVVDPVINFTPTTGKQFIKIKNVNPFTSGINSAKNYIFEIYTPVQQTANSDNQVFVEFGQQYDILDPTLPTRRHSGMVTDQIVGSVPAEYNFYEGDAYYRLRTIAVGDVGYQTFNVMDRNFVDFYISAVNSVDGRPSIIDINAREAYYSTLIRHGEAYQANTNINGLNRFYSKNFDEYDYSFGDALGLVVKNRQLVVLQKYKIGAVTLFSSIGKDQNGLTVVFNTDKLLNPIQYYIGDFGIGTCPESIASFNYAVYGCDNIKGIIWRLSNDGLIALSIKYKMNSWANDNLNQSVSNQKVYGAFDQRLNNYIIALSGSNAQTLIWDEEENRFETFVSLFPEMMVTLGTTLCAFKDGILWTHDDDEHYNNFFGVQYDSYITMVFNKSELDKKTFTVVEEIASQPWDCPEIITTSNSYGKTKQTSNLIVSDFEELEGNYNAAFLGASNSIGGLIDGDSLKGNLMSIKFRAIIPEQPNNLLVSLSLIKVNSINSPLNADK